MHSSILLGKAINPLRHPESRVRFYREHETEAWFEAIRERGFPFNALPHEQKKPVYDLLCARQGR